MSKLLTRKISIFLSADAKAMQEYYNGHDPAPLYKRQLSHGFEAYIVNSIAAIKRHTQVTFNVCYKEEEDRENIETLVYSIRRHFQEKKSLKEAEFEKFKRRSYQLLLMSLAAVILFQGLVPYVLNADHRIHSGLSNSLDVLCWVILWRPIDKLIFSWNPYLKDISILDRLSKAEIIVIDNEE
jgi:hypothetical protein